MMDESERMDDRRHGEDAELEQLLRAYAGARLSPDRWATVRMRAAVIEHGHAARTRAARGWSWSRLRRPLALLAIVGILAVGTGASAAMAASPGGPLYGTRLWVEGTILDLTVGGTAASVDQMNSRFDDITNAVDSGNANAANAAAQAYSNEVDAAAQAAQDRADLLDLRTTIARHLVHLQSLPPGKGKGQANVDKAIANAQAALSEIDAKLAALPTPSPANPGPANP